MAGGSSGGAAIVCLGEALIDFIAHESGVSIGQVGSFTRAPGGAPANVAVAIARLGGRAAFVGRVGDDDFGHGIVMELAASGVDTSGIRRDREARTGLAFVASDRDGEPHFLFYRHPAADMRLAPEDLDAGQIQGAAALHVGTLSLAAEPSASATRRALQLAAEAGVIRSCDLNFRPAMWPSDQHLRRVAAELVAVCDIVKASADEATALTGCTAASAAARSLLSLGPRLAVVTMGARGAAYAMPEAEGTVPGYRVRAVDTTGAGDAFVGAMLAELARRDLLRAPGARPGELPTVLSVANAAGALATMTRGAIPSLPTRGQLDAFLAAALARPGDGRAMQRTAVEP